MKTNKVIITKDEFLLYIKELQKVQNFQDDLAEISRKYWCGDFWDYPNLSFVCCKMLTKLLGLEDDERFGSDVDYFVDELNFGEDWKPGMIKDKDGNDLDWSTPEKFYDWVVSNESEET